MQDPNNNHNTYKLLNQSLNLEESIFGGEINEGNNLLATFNSSGEEKYINPVKFLLINSDNLINIIII